VSRPLIFNEPLAADLGRTLLASACTLARRFFRQPPADAGPWCWPRGHQFHFVPQLGDGRTAVKTRWMAAVRPRFKAPARRSRVAMAGLPGMLRQARS
jgi:hypothetical protein